MRAGLSRWPLTRAFRNVLDRLAHPSRRQAALEQLRAAPPPRSILIVCHGNLCRSPYAEAALRRRLETSGLNVTIASSGFSVPNRRPPAEAIDAASARGFDLSAHRSRSVSPADRADVVLVADPDLRTAVAARTRSERVVVLGDLDPVPIQGRAIADPMGENRAAFDACYERIDRCLEELVRAFAAARPPDS